MSYARDENGKFAKTGEGSYPCRVTVSLTQPQAARLLRALDHFINYDLNYQNSWDGKDEAALHKGLHTLRAAYAYAVMRQESKAAKQ